MTERRSAGIVRPSPILLPVELGLRRDPPRPPELRQPDYEGQFDYTTLLYDLFDYDGMIAGVGPPLFNLKKAVSRFSYRFGSNRLIPDFANKNRMSRWRFVKEQHMDVSRFSFRRQFARLRSRLRALGDRTSAKRRGQFVVDFGCGHLGCAEVGSSYRSIFAGTRCLLTKSKNNDLRWIHDWVDFHVRVHGANAVLFYDNGSDKYSCEDILDELQSIDGLDALIIVHWPFIWGPHGETSGVWDSDFAQHGMLEHARWRFLTSACSVLYQDVDEFALSERSVFEIAETSARGAILYEGRWIENVLTRPTGADSIRHSDFIYFDPNAAPASPKWCAVPKRTSVSDQWRVHWVTPADKTKEVSLRHFRGITTGWKIARPPQSYNQVVHLVDEDLVRLFSELGYRSAADTDLSGSGRLVSDSSS